MAQDRERQHLTEVFGPPAGELSVGSAGERIAVLYFIDDEEEDPSVFFVTLGLGAREPLPGAERYELGIHISGAYSDPDLERTGRALLTIAQRLTTENAIVVPERIVEIAELEREFPGRSQALVTDFMYRGPDHLPIDGTTEKARLLFLRPLFEGELRWVRTMSQAQVGEVFARSDVRLEDSHRGVLLLTVGPHILPDRKEASSMAPSKASVPAKRDIKSLYDSLEKWLKDKSPQMHSELQAPVSSDDLKALEGALGRRLPDDLREALQIHDGRPSFDYHMLLWAERIQQRYEREMKNVDQASATPGDGTCRAVVWSKGWIPFAEDGGQNFLCIDLDPGPKGTAGQVIRWERSSRRAGAAQWKSFGEWFGSIVGACLAGDVDIDPDGSIFLK